jgi:hypothetical protein
MRTHLKRVQATVRAYYTNASGDPATKRPHATKDVDDQPDAPAQLTADSWATVYPLISTVPTTATAGASCSRAGRKIEYLLEQHTRMW